MCVGNKEEPEGAVMYFITGVQLFMSPEEENV